MKQRVCVFFTILFFPFLAFSQGSGSSEESRSPGEPFDVFIPSRTGPAVTPGSEPLPRSYRKLQLGMSLDELKDALAEDTLFVFRGDPDVSFLPAKEENLVETTGLSFVRRAFFQLREKKVFIMAFSLDSRRVDHYSIFISLIKKYGEPVRLNPQEAVWENEETRVSLERPLTVKYIDMTVFKAIMGESKTEETAEVFLRRRFLNEF